MFVRKNWVQTLLKCPPLRRCEDRHLESRLMAGTEYLYHFLPATAQHTKAELNTSMDPLVLLRILGQLVALVTMGMVMGMGQDSKTILQRTDGSLKKMKDTFLSLMQMKGS